MKYDVTIKWDDKTTHHKNVSDNTPLYHTPPVRELTNDEILSLWDWDSGEVLATDILDFADLYRRALLGEEGLIERNDK